MIKIEELEDAIKSMSQNNFLDDLESAIKILNSSVISHCYINAGRVDVVSRAIKCVLNYLNSPTNRSVTETRRENVRLKKELENKDKMIELMVNALYDEKYEELICMEVDCRHIEIQNEGKCIGRECIKEYFKKKAEESE